MEESGKTSAGKEWSIMTKIRAVAIAALGCAVAAAVLSLSLNADVYQGARPPLIFGWLAVLVVLLVVAALISSSVGLILTRFRGAGFYVLLALAVAFAVRMVLDP